MGPKNKTVKCIMNVYLCMLEILYLILNISCKMFTMRDLALPQQLHNTGYWKELQGIAILSGNLDVEVPFYNSNTSIIH